MAAPVVPTLSSLTTEAIKKMGYSSPTSAQLTRAQNEFMQEVKSDICRVERRLKSLYKTAYTTTEIGRSRYANPLDYFADLDMTLLEGTQTGTAQAGTTSSITLAASEDATEDWIKGKEILDTTNKSFSQVTSYSAATKIAGVNPNFATAPSNGDGYLIVENYYSGSWFHKIGATEFDNIYQPTLKSRPLVYTEYRGSTVGEFMLYPVPEKVYGLQMKYFANLLTLDLASTLMSTLYQNWRDIWVYGVAAKQAEVDDDTKFEVFNAKYQAALMAMVNEERCVDGFTSGMVESAY